jgi:hypothetical protein
VIAPSPAHIDEALGLTDTVGKAFTLTVVLDVLVQPALSVTVIVYIPVAAVVADKIVFC